ncbi:MAG: hypothetical protein ACXACI_04435 [Candidatus Hodarchaeales archaeon]
MPTQVLSLLIRSERVPIDRLMPTCAKVARLIREQLPQDQSGRIHLLPANRGLVWLEYSPEVVTAGIVTVAVFGGKIVVRRIPVMRQPNIVLECPLQLLTPPDFFEDHTPTAEALTDQLTEILGQCHLKVQETRVMAVQI